MDEKFLIHIEIAGRRYPLNILRSEEEQVRAAALQINQKMSKYQQRFVNQVDNLDLLAMVALQLSLRNLQLEEVNETTPFVEKIQQVTQELEEYLKGK